MADTFVIEWNLPGIQNRVGGLEALEHEVRGAEAVSPERAVDGILTTSPDVVVVWANSHVERTREVLEALRRKKEPEELPQFVFVDGDPQAQERLQGMVRGRFVHMGRLDEAVKKAARK